MHRSADVRVPLTLPGHPPGLHGSVLGSGQAREWLQFLMGRPPKDALLYLRKWLKEAARKEGVQLKSTRSKLAGAACALLWAACRGCAQRTCSEASQHSPPGRQCPAQGHSQPAHQHALYLARGPHLLHALQAFAFSLLHAAGC